MRPRCEYGGQPIPEVARPGDVGGVVRRRSSQIESMETIQGIDRSPKRRVASAPTAAVAPPKFQIDDSVLGDGGWALPSTTSVDHLVRQAAQVVALPVAPVPAERDDACRTAAAARSSPSGPEKSVTSSPSSRSGCKQRLALVGVAGEDRGDRVDALAPCGLRDSRDRAGMVENSTSDPTRSCLSARKSRQKRIGPLPASIG